VFELAKGSGVRLYVCMKIMIGIGVLVMAAMVYLFFSMGLSLGECWVLMQELLRRLGEVHPIYMCLLIVVGPAIGMPVSVLYLLSGALYGVKAGLLIIAVGLFGNLLLTYFLSAKIFHKFFKKMLLKRGFNPVIKESNMTKLVLLIRLIPGTPLVVQNYLLGMLKAPLKSYLFLSWVLLYPWAIVFLMSGNAAVEGQFRLLALGIALFFVFIFLTKFLTSRYVESKRKSVE